MLSSFAFARTSSSTKNVCATGAGSARARGFDQDAVQLTLALQQVADDADQIAAYGAANAPVVHLEHFLVGVHDQLVVDADLAELVDDDRVSAAVLLGKHAVEQRRLAGAEIAGQHGYRDRGSFEHGTSPDVNSIAHRSLSPLI
jgi:hypothetical protein